MHDVGEALEPLFCDEGSGSSSSSPAAVADARRSFPDAVLRDDGRVLSMMLRAEDGHLPATTRHLAYSHGDLRPPMRRVVVSWMLEVITVIIIYKTRHFIFYYNFHISWCVFTLFVPIESAINTLQFSHLMA